MRKLDYFRLGRISLKAKRKTTLQTVLGISFGLIILFPLLFIVIGFYGGFNAEVNSETSYRSQLIKYSPMKTFKGEVLCLEEYEKDINKTFGIKNKLKFDYCYLYNKPTQEVSFSLSCRRNGEIFKAIEPKTVSSPDRFLGIEIIDKNYAHSPFFDSDYNIPGDPLVAGRAFSRKNKSKGEIMVSTKFLKDYGIHAKDVVGSTLSIYNYVKTSSLTFSTSKDEIIKDPALKEETTIPYLLNYKVIGVYSSDIYYKRAPRTKTITYDFSNPDLRSTSHKDYFWITTASLGDNGEPIAPQRVIREKEEYGVKSYESWYYYEDLPSVLAERITSEGYAFIPFALGAFNKSVFQAAYTQTELVEYYTFQFAMPGLDKIKEYYRQSVTDDPDDDTVYNYPITDLSLHLRKFASFNERFGYICLVLGAIGGTIFVATMLNLVNTMHFSVESRRGFLGICRAIGMKKRGVRHIFFSQILIIFSRAYFATIILGGAACVWIKILFDKEVSNLIWDEAKMDITLGWWYIPISLAVMFGLTTLLSLILSVSLVRKVNKTPVLEILSEENRM